MCERSWENPPALFYHVTKSSIGVLITVAWGLLFKDVNKTVLTAWWIVSVGVS